MSSNEPIPVLSDFCADPEHLKKRLQHIPEDKLHPLCLQIMTQLQALPRYKIEHFLYYPIPTPLEKMLLCFLSEAPTNTGILSDSVLAAASDDWQAVFARTSPEVVNRCGYTVITEKNIVSLLVNREESQRLAQLRQLSQRVSFNIQRLGEDLESLRNVLQLLPKTQRIHLFFLKSGYQVICDYVPDAFWPMIKPLLEPSDMAIILQHVLEHYNGNPVTNLLHTVSIEALCQAWQRMPNNTLYKIQSSELRLKELVTLFDQLPTEAQRSVRERLFAALRHTRQYDLEPWLTKEDCFSLLLAAANQWLNNVVDIREQPFDKRLSTLATRPMELHAFLDHSPPDERRILMAWLVDNIIEDVDILTGLLERYADTVCTADIVPRSWGGPEFNWTKKMPGVLVILERLPEAERKAFASQFASYSNTPWKPENYQAVRRAHALFGGSAGSFLSRVGLNGNIPTLPLMWAVRNRDKGMASQCIRSLNDQNLYGMTALMHAYEIGNLDMARYLAEQDGCDFSIQTLGGQTVFAFAAKTRDRFALQHLINISRPKPTVQDALKVLDAVQSETRLFDFLFETYVPGIAWSSTSTALPGCSDISSLSPGSYARVTLPFVLANNQLSELTLNPELPGLFRYHTQAFGLSARDAMNLGKLLKALTGRVPPTLRLSGFHINEHERPELLEFVKNNPQLKTLCLGTLYLYPENAQAFAEELKALAVLESVELTIAQQPTIRFALSKTLARGGFFEPSARRDMVAETQASCSLRL